MYTYNIKNTEQYVTFNETSNIDYKVYLKDNKFFEDSYLEANKQYIASLIDYISAKFNYKLNLSENNITDISVLIKAKRLPNTLDLSCNNIDVNVSKNAEALEYLTRKIETVSVSEQNISYVSGDINGDGIVNSLDMTVIGRCEPLHEGGFNNTFTY
jgi:hypothetical protein